MSATAERVLTGARWSEAVRCERRAAYQGLHQEPTNDRPRWLEDAFDRGIPVGEMWGLVQGARLRAQGHEVSLEHEIPWGPGWHGHADLLDVTDAIVDEAYHSQKLEFREVKALQNAGYVDLLDEATGRKHRGVLTAINAADGDRNDGMALRRYPVEMDGPNGLRPVVRAIRERVIAAVQAEDVTLAQRVSETPKHAECQVCLFMSVCHAGFVPPVPDEIVGLEDDFNALAILKSDLHHANAKVASLEQMIRDKREPLREYLEPGVPVISGDVTVKITAVKGRVTTDLNGFVKAGHAIPPELAPFVKVGSGYGKWDVTKNEPA